MLSIQSSLWHDPNLVVVPPPERDSDSTATDWVQDREAHNQMPRDPLLAAQNKIKVQADKHRSDREFQVGDQILLKLQPYAQHSVFNRPYPKLSLKYYGPYKVLKRIGKTAYKLELPAEAKVHPVFHVSQLKPFTSNYTPVFHTLPKVLDLEKDTVEPAKIVDRRLVKKGNTAIVQVQVRWTNLPQDAITWEDHDVLRAKFPSALAWGQARTSVGEAVVDQAGAATKTLLDKGAAGV